MKTFVTIYRKEKFNINLLADLFKGLVGNNMKIEENNNVSFIFDSNPELNFLEIAELINYDLMISIKLFKGPDFADDKMLDSYLKMVDSLNFFNDSNIYYDNNYLIVANMGDRELIKKNVFKRYYRDEILDVVKAYLDSNMNVSKTADTIYMHRNTVMNKIDKFIDVTGYNIKEFQDAFVIYHLL